MSKNKGFTLIEILVVMVIIAIAISFAAISVGDFGGSRRLLISLEAVKNTLQLAQQQAILEASTLGLNLDNSGFQIMRFTPPDRWIPASNRNIFRKQAFPKDSLVYLKINHKVAAGVPPLIINASGGITPFSLTLSNTDKTTEVILNGTQNGNLTISQVTRP